MLQPLIISFITVTNPLVDTASGASRIRISSAILNGELTNGISADAWICWGTNDGGTSSIGDWDNAMPIGTVTQAVPFSTTANELWYGREYRSAEEGPGFN